MTGNGIKLKHTKLLPFSRVIIMATKSYQMDMTSGPLLKKIILFSIPLMLTSVLQLLYNAADVIVVGKFAGEASLAAVGSTTSLINLIVNSFIGLSLGTGVIVSQCIGARQKQKLHRTVHTAMLLSVFLGFFVTAIGCLLCEPILKLMGSPDEVLPKATLYMRVYFLGSPGFLVYNFGAAILRSAGDTKRPLKILSLSGIVNVALNLVFVIYFKMDVVGVATATIISQYISAIWVVILLVKDNADYKFFIKKLHIYKNELLQILAYGLPMGIQSSFFSVSNVIIQSSINSFNTLVVAGNSAASNIEGFVYAATNAVAQASMTFSGQNTGAARYDRVKKALILCCSLSLILGVVLGGLMVIFKSQLLSLYTDNQMVLQAGIVRINIIGMFYGLCAVMDTVANISRGMGKSVVPMLITLTLVCVVRIAWVFSIFKFFGTEQSIYWSYPVTWTLAIIGQLIYFVMVYKSKTKAKIKN